MELGKVYKDIVVCLHHKPSLGAMVLDPLESHHGLQGQVVIRVLEKKPLVLALKKSSRLITKLHTL